MTYPAEQRAAAGSDANQDPHPARTEDPVMAALAGLRAALSVRDLPCLLAANATLRAAIDTQRRVRPSVSAPIVQTRRSELAQCAELLVRAQAHNQRALGIYFDQPAGYGPDSPFTYPARP